MTHPLESIRILDLGQNITGPVAALVLRALGAEVIKVEVPVSGENSRSSPPYVGEKGLGYTRGTPQDIGASFLKRNRGKRGITMNLKDPTSREVFERLLKTSDVLIENFRPGVFESLGYSFERLQDINPKLTLCSISGFGDISKYQNWLAYDGIIQAFSGVMEKTGFADNPPVKSGVAVGDSFAALFGAIGALAALQQRARTGRGTHVKVSMLECILFMLWDDPLDFFAKMGRPPRSGNSNRRSAPWSMYPTSDGNLFICAMTDAQWQIIAGIMDIADPDGLFVNRDKRVANEPELNRRIAEWCKHRSKDEVAELLQGKGVPCSAVRTPAEVANDPAIAAAGAFNALLHPLMTGPSEMKTAAFPLKSFGSHELIDQPAPALGQDNAALLRSLGYDERSIDSLLSSGAMASQPVRGSNKARK